MPGGRKSKYTPDMVSKITEGVELGLTFRLACSYAGISEPTFYHWMATKPEFAEVIKAAEGKMAAANQKLIRHAAMTGSWQAAAWTLERRFPQEYGRRVVEQQGRDGGPIQVQAETKPPNYDHLTPQQKYELYEALDVLDRLSKPQEIQTVEGREEMGE